MTLPSTLFCVCVAATIDSEQVLGLIRGPDKVFDYILSMVKRTASLYHLNWALAWLMTSFRRGFQCVCMSRHPETWEVLLRRGSRSIKLRDVVKLFTRLLCLGSGPRILTSLIQSKGWLCDQIKSIRALIKVFSVSKQRKKSPKTRLWCQIPSIIHDSAFSVMQAPWTFTASGS